MLGLGVFGLVDVTVEGIATGAGGGPFALLLLLLFAFICRSVVGDFNEILNEFSSIRPFELNCMANGDEDVCWPDIMPVSNKKGMGNLADFGGFDMSSLTVRLLRNVPGRFGR